MELKVIDNSVAKLRRHAGVHVGFSAININKAMFKKMGEPRYVKVAVDQSERIFGIAVCEKEDDGSRKCTVSAAGQCTVSCRNAAVIIRGMTGDSTRCYTFLEEEKDGDYYIFHIDKGITK